jgi:hypothetical protein
VIGIQSGAAVRAAAVSPDGTRLAAGGPGRSPRVLVRDTASGRQLPEVRHGTFVTAAAFSPDGIRLATGSGGKAARGLVRGRVVARRPRPGDPQRPYPPAISSMRSRRPAWPGTESRIRWQYAARVSRMSSADLVHVNGLGFRTGAALQDSSRRWPTGGNRRMRWAIRSASER